MLPLGFNDDDDEALLAELAQFDEELEDAAPPEDPGIIGVTVNDLGTLPSVPLIAPGKTRSDDVTISLSSEPIAL